MQSELPIHELAEQLRHTWRNHSSMVIVAPTGSGKTTQVCQLLLADGVLNGKRIVILQPRRVAARSVATRVAEEMNVDVGALVGYQVRFDERLTDDTQIAFVTEGILLRWLQADENLTGVGAVLFDEFHERNLLSDISLALCKRLQQTTRPDLKLIVMSATLEAAPVAAYLAQDAAPVPVLESQGRSYPVDMVYQAWDDDAYVWERAAAAVNGILDGSSEGDILVFMPGMYEIQRTIEEVKRRPQPKTGVAYSVLMLHGEMSPNEQDRAFAPSSYRRIIVATNVAETSITIPNIRFVVDSGMARVARYQPSQGINTLHVEAISQASADQRAGRAGRVAPGVCYRLWSQENHNQRPIKNTPEVQRTELSAVVLQLHGLGVGDVATFDFLDKPSKSRIRAADELLESLGAVLPTPQAENNSSYAITPIGQQMLQMPVHPRYARMLIEAQKYGIVREGALMAALVSGRDLLARLNVRDERDKPIKRNRDGLMKKGQNTSDFFLLANAFAHAAKNNFDGKACWQYGVNAHVAREVQAVFGQLVQICEEVGLLQKSTALAATILDDGDELPLPNAAAALPPPALQVENAEAIAKCHLVGFLDHLAVRTSSGSDEYDLAGGRRCTLVDESVIGRNMLIVASEIREITTRSGNKLTLLGFGSAVKLDWVLALKPSGLIDVVEHVYDRLTKRVVAGRVIRYHDLVLGGSRVNELDLQKAAAVLAEEYAHQLGKLSQWSQLKHMLAARPEFKKREEIVRWLTQAFYGITTAEEAIDHDVVSTLRTWQTSVGQ